MASVVAVCISERKGTKKHPVEQITLKREHGIVGDAHAGKWHRQVSLLALEKIEDFRAKGAKVDFGAFGENLIVDGFRFRELPVGTRLRAGDVLLEITQIGKECHADCAIRRQAGDCVMPREGIFVIVLEEGDAKAGDRVTLVEN
jgi:MOSC domain-containing protein YiiM